MMATVEQIKNMIRAYKNHDDDKFKTIVLQIAAHEAKLGHNGVAQELKNEAESIKSQRSSIVKFPANNPMLQCSKPLVRLSELIVKDEVKLKIQRILIEYRNRHKLYNSGLSNRRRILLEGNPGTGKTLTASIIASELNLRLFTVQVDKLVTKFMGETSTRLRQIFDSITQDPGVYLFDEFDAIGADRSLDNEVGEMRRILNSFLQFIESDTSESIILAATNNPLLLDKALFRRFDDVIHYSLPDDDEICRLFEYKLGNYASSSVINEKVIKASRGLSHAELSLVCQDAMKNAILFSNTIDSMMLLNLLNERRSIYTGKEA